MKCWEKRQTELYHSLYQMAHSSQNPLTLPTTLIIFSLARLANMPAANPDTTHQSTVEVESLHTP